MDITLEKLELIHKIQKKFILWVFLLLNLMTQVSHGCQLIMKTCCDYHALWINPNKSGHLIVGNDGGINISYDEKIG